MEKTHNKLFEGVGVALVTPFDNQNNIDFEALKRLIHHVSNANISYLVVNGTTGESVTTSIEEKIDILKAINKYNKKNLPLVFGIGGNNTNEIIAQFDKYDFKNISAILSISPYYNKPTQEGIYKHYESISKVTPVPIILYNCPSRTASNITAETTLRLAQLKNIIGIKESSGNMFQCAKIMKYCPKDFILISGNDTDTIPLIALGAKGVISVLGNAFPLHMKKIVSYAIKNDYEKSRKYFFDLLDLDTLLYQEGNPVGIKQLLDLMFICKNYVRQPLHIASESLKIELDKVLNKIAIKA